MRRVLFLADAHLGDDPSAVTRFLALLRGIGPETAHLFLLGDLFETWIAIPHLQEDHHQKVLEGLREVRARGVGLHYVEGNRDFAVRRLCGNPFLEVTSRALDLSFAGRRVLVAHGDLVNRGDIAYRAWRALARNPVSLTALRILPGTAGRRAARHIERALRGTNRGQKTRFPESGCRAFAGRASAAGYDLVVLGHFHEARDLRYPGLPPRFELRVLPAWFDDPRPLALYEDGSLRHEALLPANGAGPAEAGPADHETSSRR